MAYAASVIAKAKALRNTMTSQDIAIALAALQEDHAELAEAARDFIRKVDTGRARSVDSYNKFKKALGE